MQFDHEKTSKEAKIIFSKDELRDSLRGMFLSGSDNVTFNCLDTFEGEEIKIMSDRKELSNYKTVDELVVDIEEELSNEFELTDFSVKHENTFLGNMFKYFEMYKNMELLEKPGAKDPWYPTIESPTYWDYVFEGIAYMEDPTLALNTLTVADLRKELDKNGLRLPNKKELYINALQNREILNKFSRIFEGYEKDIYKELTSELSEVETKAYKYAKQNPEHQFLDAMEYAADDIDKAEMGLAASFLPLYKLGYYDRVGRESGFSGDVFKDIKEAQYLMNIESLYENYPLILNNIAIDELKSKGVPFDLEVKEFLDNIDHDRVEPTTDFIKEVDEFADKKIQDLNKEKDVDRHDSR